MHVATTHTVLQSCCLSLDCDSFRKVRYENNNDEDDDDGDNNNDVNGGHCKKVLKKKHILTRIV